MRQPHGHLRAPRNEDDQFSGRGVGPLHVVEHQRAITGLQHTRHRLQQPGPAQRRISRRQEFSFRQLRQQPREVAPILAKVRQAVAEVVQVFDHRRERHLRQSFAAGDPARARQCVFQQPRLADAGFAADRDQPSRLVRHLGQLAHAADHARRLDHCARHAGHRHSHGGAHRCLRARPQCFGQCDRGRHRLQPEFGVQPAAKALKRGERLVAPATAAGHTQQRLHRVFGAGIRLQQPQQQRRGRLRLASLLVRQRGFEHGIAPGIEQSLPFAARPLLEQREAAEGHDRQQRLAVQRNRGGPVGAAEGGAVDGRVGRQIDAHAAAVGLQGLAPAPARQQRPRPVQVGAQVVLRLVLGALGPEQPGQRLAAHPVAAVGEVGDDIAGKVVGNVPSFARRPRPMRRTEQIQLAFLRGHAAVFPVGRRRCRASLRA